MSTREACGEVLWDDNGTPIAVCTQPAGSEHNHSDCSAGEALEKGIARMLTPDDVLRCVDPGPANEVIPYRVAVTVTRVYYLTAPNDAQARVIATENMFEDLQEGVLRQGEDLVESMECDFMTGDDTLDNRGLGLCDFLEEYQTS